MNAGERMLVVLCCSLVLAAINLARSETKVAQAQQNTSRVYLGFDANDYPGDSALPDLRKTFTFSGYWLNAPPGAKTNLWTGKRDVLIKNGFGFLLLFNGRLSQDLKPPIDPGDLGARDAERAVAAAQRDGFPANESVVIYLDMEEGGRMLPSQINYMESWTAGVNSKGFLAGVYCSGIKAKEGKDQTITSAEDIHQRLPMIRAFFVYNDECPPSPGCVIWKNPPLPSQSGFSGARVWQFAQSPRRRNLTSRCSATYRPDGNCYSPVGPGAAHILLDLDVSMSADPSTLGFGSIH
jgi:Domain of unknown function (DUF1906)